MIYHCVSYPSSSFIMVFFSIKYYIIGDHCRAKGILTIVLHDNDQTDEKLESQNPQIPILNFGESLLVLLDYEIETVGLL